MPTANEDDNRCARRVYDHERRRVVVLPPEGHGDIWAGGHARQTPKGTK